MSASQDLYSATTVSYRFLIHTETDDFQPPHHVCGFYYSALSLPLSLCHVLFVVSSVIHVSVKCPLVLMSLVSLRTDWKLELSDATGFESTTTDEL